MSNPEKYDLCLEGRSLRHHGVMGRGQNMGNALFATGYNHLPAEAKKVIAQIIAGGPFDHPKNDGTVFGNRFGDLPGSGQYLEFTVKTPGASNRGARRLVLRKNGMLFFTACHYERVSGRMTPEKRVEETLKVDWHWRNGFYVVTGMAPEMRFLLGEAAKKLILR